MNFKVLASFVLHITTKFVYSVLFSKFCTCNYFFKFLNRRFSSVERGHNSVLYSSGVSFLVVPRHPQILADQLTLSQPGGDRLCPPNYYWHPWIFRPSDGPAVGTRCTTWTVNVSWSIFTFFVLIDIYPFRQYKGYNISTKTKRYIFPKTSLTVHSIQMYMDYLPPKRV